MSITEHGVDTPRRAGKTVRQTLSAAALVNQTGRVKWFNDEKGFGFITPDDRKSTNGRDIFVYYAAILMEGRRTLTAGEAVTFILDFNEKGPIAVGVKRQ